MYGTDNSSVGETVSVRYDLWAATGSIRTPDHWAFGRCVARRRGRDSNVELGPQVVVLEGGFESRGGSVKNPDLAPVEGTVVEIRDIPAGHIDVETDTNILEVIRPAPHVIALRAEHAKLTARLAEIDAILEQEAGDA